MICMYFDSNNNFSDSLILLDTCTYSQIFDKCDYDLNTKRTINYKYGQHTYWFHCLRVSVLYLHAQSVIII